MEKEVKQQPMQVGDNIVVTYEGDKGFSLAFNGTMNYQDSVAMAGAVFYKIIEAYSNQLHSADLEEEELEAYKTFAYDDLNDRFAHFLEPLTPKVIEADIDEQIAQDMSNEDLMIELRFKAMQYDKIVEQSKDVAKPYVKISIKENGELVI